MNRMSNRILAARAWFLLLSLSLSACAHGQDGSQHPVAAGSPQSAPQSATAAGPTGSASQQPQANGSAQSASQQSPATGPAPQRILPADTHVVLTHPDEYYGEARIGTYVSSTWGFSTSSYWIEGPEGLILIDTQFLPSAAEEFVDWAEKATGKKAVLAIVLHANPDKFNGTAVMQKRGIKVVTSSQVRALIPAIHEKRLKAFYDRYQPDYPKDFALPDSLGDKSTEISAAGLTVKVHVLGPGCSEAHIAVEYEGNLFVGDLVGNGSHSWLEIGRTDEWLKRLEELKALKPDFVHPGRGPTGDDRLLDMEENYLRHVIAAVSAEKPKGEPSDEALERIKNRIDADFKGYRFGVFLNIGLPAEWRRQASGGK